MTAGSTPITLVGDAVMPLFDCNTEFVGESKAGPSATPTSQLSMGAVRPVTWLSVRVPARLSQKMLLNSSGLL